MGYANGRTQNPTYEQVCYNDTGHAETVKTLYDSHELSLSGLLSLYYEAVDPTSLNRQGGDHGTQYRTGIYYVNQEDEAEARASLAKLQQTLQKPVAVELLPLDGFYPAEEYHQKYLDKNPGGYCHISPAKIERAALGMKKQEYVAPDKQALKASLTPEQYRVTQENGTEPPFRNEFWDHFQPGVYVDITTGQPLFISADKFESGCGWPSFSKPISKSGVKERSDTSHGMARTEVRSTAGDAHLGHVFTDGPVEAGGLRYCINSAALRFIPKEKMKEQGYGEYLKYLQPGQ